MDRISHSFILRAPIHEVFEYYVDPRHVARMTPSELNLRIVSADVPLRPGARVLFAMRPRMVPFELQWLVEVAELVPGKVFVDRILRGPFTHWEHRHEFEELEDGATRVTDSIEFGQVSSVLAALVGTDFVRRKIVHLFHNREAVLRSELEKSASADAASVTRTHKQPTAG